MDYRLNYSPNYQTDYNAPRSMGAHIIVIILVIIILILLYIIYRLAKQIKNLRNSLYEETNRKNEHMTANNNCRQTLDKQSTQTNANQNVGPVNANNKIDVVLYYAMWCGYSKQFLPIWNQFKAMAKQKYGDALNIREADCSDETAPGYDKSCSLVNGFPSVVFYVNNKPPLMFDKDRTVAGLDGFTAQVLAGQ